MLGGRYRRDTTDQNGDLNQKYRQFSSMLARRQMNWQLSCLSELNEGKIAKSDILTAVGTTSASSSPG
jgi:hypothetical protein